MPRDFNLKRVLEPVKDIVRKLKDRRAVLMEEVSEIDSHLISFDGKIGRRLKSNLVAGGVETGNGLPTFTKRKGKRTRRSREQLVAMAGEVVEFIKSKGKDGAAAKEIQAKFGSMAPSVNAWLKSYSPIKVKTTGHKSQTRYYA